MVFCLVNYTTVDRKLIHDPWLVVGILDYEDLAKHFHNELKNVSYDKIMFITLYQGMSCDQEESSFPINY